MEEITGRGQKTPDGRIPFASPAKKVLELALREALELGHNYIGTEHLLLGLLHEADGTAARVVVAAGVQPDQLREAVLALVQSVEAAIPAEGL